MTALQHYALPLAFAAAALSPAVQVASACTAKSGVVAPPVVELYTSEGCNSCPPADKWLSRLKADPSVVALAFHVDYWDRLGWKDRFGSAAFTQRQAEQQRSSGARFSYTPQVILNGVDRPDWPRASVIAGPVPANPVEAQLAREGDRVTATIKAAGSSPVRLAAYWAVTEQGHLSAVKAGENQGATLAHDYVVRDYRPVAAWSSKPDGSPTTLQFQLAGAADAAHPRQVNLVIVDAASGRPVQALKLAC
ncbi:MAG: DUF1223 domain-containing protein [Rhizobiales bacterium]|nr:DUF1223 domain-containing protein [Rhizobacter sp.]